MGTPREQPEYLAAISNPGMVFFGLHDWPIERWYKDIGLTHSRWRPQSLQLHSVMGIPRQELLHGLAHVAQESYTKGAPLDLERTLRASGRDHLHDYFRKRMPRPETTLLMPLLSMVEVHLPTLAAEQISHPENRKFWYAPQEMVRAYKAAYEHLAAKANAKPSKARNAT